MHVGCSCWDAPSDRGEDPGQVLQEGEEGFQGVSFLRSGKAYSGGNERPWGKNAQLLTELAGGWSLFQKLNSSLGELLRF